MESKYQLKSRLLCKCTSKASKLVPLRNLGRRSGFFLLPDVRRGTVLVAKEAYASYEVSLVACTLTNNDSHRSRSAGAIPASDPHSDPTRCKSCSREPGEGGDKMCGTQWSPWEQHVRGRT